MRDHRIRRAARQQAAADPGARAPRVPGLRLGRDRAAGEHQPRLRPRGRKSQGPEGSHEDERLVRQDRPRPHALGDPRQGLARECAPAHGLRRGQARDRAERDRRELPRAEGIAARRGPHVQLRDRRRGRRPPDRARLHRRSRRRRPGGVRTARGSLLVRRDPPRPPARARRRPLPDAARRRRGRGGDVPRLLDRRVPVGDAPRAVPRGRPGRDDPARGRHLLRLRAAARHRDRLGRGKRRQGRLRDLHAQGDLRAARGGARDDRRPRPRAQAAAREPRDGGGADPQPPPGRRGRLRHRVPRRRRRPLRARGVGADPGRAGHRERVDLPEPGALAGHARDRHLAVGRDSRHRQRDEARPRRPARGRSRSRT